MEFKLIKHYYLTGSICSPPPFQLEQWANVLNFSSFTRVYKPDGLTPNCGNFLKRTFEVQMASWFGWPSNGKCGRSSLKYIKFERPGAKWAELIERLLQTRCSRNHFCEQFICFNVSFTVIAELFYCQECVGFYPRLFQTSKPGLLYLQHLLQIVDVD